MLLWVLVGVAGAGASCVLYGMLVEHHWFRLARYRLDILPTSAGTGITILHLSDLHFVVGDRRKQRFIEALPPADVTIVTGDILGEADAVEAVVAVLARIRARLGSFFVLGSNDYYRPRPLNYFHYFTDDRSRRRRIHRSRANDLARALEAEGWVHLKNVRREVTLDGVAVELLGLDDPHIHRADLSVAPRRASGRFGLAVVHSPDPAPELAALGYDLIVAGHTHGGQVRFPIVGALVTNSHMPRALAMGLHRLGGSFLHVSPGIGTSKYAPFRFLCRPEAALLELFPERNDGDYERRVSSESTRSNTRS
jgi:predicted MPP superfamily phosphohydrolase